jgi:non-ribosomal peptide synthetase component F
MSCGATELRRHPDVMAWDTDGLHSADADRGHSSHEWRIATSPQRRAARLETQLPNGAKPTSTAPTLTHSLQPLTRTRPALGQRAVAAGRAASPVFFLNDTLSIVIYTSGSTGTPKGAMYPERLGLRRCDGSCPTSSTWCMTAGSILESV